MELLASMDLGRRVCLCFLSASLGYFSGDWEYFISDTMG